MIFSHFFRSSISQGKEVGNQKLVMSGNKKVMDHLEHLKRKSENKRAVLCLGKEKIREIE